MSDSHPGILSGYERPTFLLFNQDFDSFQYSSLRQSLIQNQLKEIHYVPYNSSDSPSIYLYTIYKNRILVSVKDNTFKQIYFTHKQLKLVNSIEQTIEDNDENPSQLEFQMKETTSLNDSISLEPVVDIFKFPKIPEGSSISSIDVINVNNYCVFSVAFALVNLKILMIINE